MNDICKISQQHSKRNQAAKVARTQPQPARGKGGNRPNKVIAIAIIAIGLLALIGAVYYYKFSDPGVKTDKYQAVFLADGQVYFGKLSGVNNKYLKMTDVYYLQTNNQKEVTEESGEQSQPGLIKLGSEVHGPEDELRINAEQVSYWENLKSDSKVSSAIKEFKKQK